MDKEQISSWFDEGVFTGATFMLVVFDDTDDPFPVYVSENELVGEVVENINETPSLLVKSIYKMSLDKERQLNEWNSWLTR